MNLGGAELLIVVAVIVMVFGAGWLPKAARNLGKAKVEFDQVQKQIEDTKKQVVEASGVKELEATMRKANKALNTTPQGMMKNAAKSAMKPVTPESAPTSESAEPAKSAEADSPTTDTNLNIDFS